MDIFEKVKQEEKNQATVSGEKFIEVESGMFIPETRKQCDETKADLLMYEYYSENSKKLPQTWQAKRRAKKIFKIFDKQFGEGDFFFDGKYEKVFEKLNKLLDQDVNLKCLSKTQMKEIISKLCNRTEGWVSPRELINLAQKLHDCGLDRDIWFSDGEHSSFLGFRFLSSPELSRKEHCVAYYIDNYMPHKEIEKLVNTRQLFSLKKNYPFTGKRLSVYLFEYGRMPLSRMQAQNLCKHFDAVGQEVPNSLRCLAGLKYDKVKQLDCSQEKDKKTKSDVEVQVDGIFSKAQTQEL